MLSLSHQVLVHLGSFGVTISDVSPYPFRYHFQWTYRLYPSQILMKNQMD